MGAIGIGLVWGSYTIGLWAWCLLTGRNVSITQLVSFTTWPPTSPSATSAASASSGSSPTGTPTPGSTGTVTYPTPSGNPPATPIYQMGQ
jgi:hypothetical protein